MNTLLQDNEHLSTMDGGTIRKEDYDSRPINIPGAVSSDPHPMRHDIKDMITKQNHISVIDTNNSLHNHDVYAFSLKLRLIKAQKLRLRNKGNTPLITLF